MDVNELRNQMGVLNAEARKIMDTADKRGDGLTTEEQAQVDKLYAEFDTVKDQVAKIEGDAARRAKAEEAEAFLSASVGRRTSPNSATSKPSDRATRTIKMGKHTYEINPDHPMYEAASPEYRALFGSYMTHGVNAGLRTTSDPMGGYLAPTSLSNTVIQGVDDAVFMRQIANVLPPLTTSVSLGIVSYDTDLADTDWTAEVPASDIAEDDAMRFGKRELRPHLSTKLVKVSKKMLAVSSVPLESFIGGRFAYKFAKTEESAFMTGNGVQKPLGVFVASDDGIPTSRDVSTTAATSFTADDLIDWVYTLKPAYRANARIVTSPEFVTKVRKLKGGDGHYLWQPALSAGNPATICSIPVIESEFAPSTFTASQYVALIGDFMAGYTIVDGINFGVQRLNELLSLRNQVGFLGARETDGMPVLSEAFVRLQMHS